MKKKYTMQILRAGDDQYFGNIISSRNHQITFTQKQRHVKQMLRKRLTI